MFRALDLFAKHNDQYMKQVLKFTKKYVLNGFPIFLNVLYQAYI
jgi:hypothetical protein